MQNPSRHEGRAGGLPLTHQAYSVACSARRPKPWVQVRRRVQGTAVVLCGQVAELNANEGEWFKVETWIGPVWAESRNVRMCSGDGRCTCEAMAEESARGRAASREQSGHRTPEGTPRVAPPVLGVTR